MIYAGLVLDLPGPHNYIFQDLLVLKERSGNLLEPNHMITMLWTYTGLILYRISYKYSITNPGLQHHYFVCTTNYGQHTETSLLSTIHDYIRSTTNSSEGCT